MNAITAKNVSKKYISGNEKNILFNDMSLTVQEGEVVFISGHYGSGRTTFLKMIAAMTPPNHGTIEVFGKNLLDIKKRTDWRLKHIGFLTNKDYLIPYLTVKQHLLMGEDEDDPLFDFFSDEAKYILAMLEIGEEKLSLYPRSLSKIDRLKTTVARVLMANPRILLVDEFTKGIADEDRFNLHKLIVEYARNQNTTIIITGETDYCYFADRILKLKDGKFIELDDSNKNKKVLH